MNEWVRSRNFRASGGGCGFGREKFRLEHIDGQLCVARCDGLACPSIESPAWRFASDRSGADEIVTREIVNTSLHTICHQPPKMGA